MSRVNGDPGPSHRDAGSLTNGNMIMGNANTLDNQPFASDETVMPVSSGPTYTRLEGSIKHTGSIPTLRELVRISLIWILLLSQLSHCLISALHQIPVCIGRLGAVFSISAFSSI